MKYLRTLLTAGLLAASTPALAADFSFTGNFENDDDVVFFNFVVGLPSTVSLVSFSWAGGVNSANQTIVRGGFDPILSIYDGSGALVAFNDDGAPGTVPVDPLSNGRAFDVFFQQTLAAGSYTVALSQFNNFGGATLADPFPRAGQTSFTGTRCGQPGAQFLSTGFGDCTQRTNAWAFDLRGVESAVIPGVPEPTTWALMIMGFGMVGHSMRRRSKLTLA